MYKVIELSYKDIIPGDNPRVINKKELLKSDLFESIKQFGVMVPVVVCKGEKNGDHVLVSGYRRFECAKELKVEKIPCLLIDNTDKEVGLHNFIENACRLDLNPMEQAEAAVLLVEKLDDKKLAALALGISEGTLNKRLKIAGISPAWKKLVKERTAEDRGIPLAVLDIIAPLDLSLQSDLAGRLAHWYFGNNQLQELREYIDNMLMQIDKAMFDAQSCKACKSSTASKQELFTEYAKAPRCMNPACWHEKTTIARNEKIAAFKKDHPAGIIISNGEKYAEELEHYHTYDLSTTGKKEFAALDPVTGKVTMVALVKNSSPAKGTAGPKTMDDKKESLGLRRVNCVREQLEKLLPKVATPKLADVMALLWRFGTESHQHICDAKDWRKDVPENHVDDLFKAVKGTLLERLHHSGSASQLPKDMEVECKSICTQFGIDYKKLWIAAETAHPIPKSWSKK